jgi:hypothetical protein
MTRPTIDPDVTRRDDGPYWAAAMAIAVRDGDRERAALARRNLRRLGYHLDLAADNRLGGQHVD